MIKVTDNFEKAAEVLDRVARRAGNTVGLMRQFTGIMHDQVEENFAKEGRPGKWKPLAASTIRRRKAKGNWPGKILQVRGRLATGWEPKYDNNSAVYGTNVKYAAIQNFGGTTKHAAMSRVLHFGKVHEARRGENSVGPGRPTRSFAKPGKAKLGMKVEVGAHETTIPARPFLYIGPEGVQKMIDAAKAWLMNNSWF
jgi:phage virion morphogenesis protein